MRLHNGDGVSREIDVPAPPIEVWLALTEPSELSAWFGADVEIEPRPGGVVRASWPDGARSVGSVEVVEPRRRLAFRWRRIAGAGLGARVGAATRVEFVLRPTAGGTAVCVTEEPVELATVMGAP